MRFLIDLESMRSTPAPLTHGRPEQEYAYVAIDAECRGVDAYVTDRSESRGWQCGTVGRYRLSPLVDGEALAEFLKSDKFRELVKRIIDGTRIETVEGRTIGLANGSARAAETELAWLLTQLPDHAISFCTAENWLSAQGDFLEVWADGTFEEAVEQLEAAFEQTLSDEGVRVLGRWNRFAELSDIGDTLIDEACKRFERGDQLYRCHIEALAYFRLINDVHVQEWEKANAEPSADRVGGVVGATVQRPLPSPEPFT